MFIPFIIGWLGFYGVVLIGENTILSCTIKEFKFGVNLTHWKCLFVPLFINDMTFGNGYIEFICLGGIIRGMILNDTGRLIRIE